MSTSDSHEIATFWCHECELSVEVIPPVSFPAPLCPHCTSEFVEQMDAPVNHHYPFFSDDFFGGSDLEEEELQFFNTNPALSFRMSDDSDSDPDLEVIVDDGRPSPATKSSIDAVPTVEITEDMIGSLESCLSCAVCKDDFVVGVKAKRLHCGHIYHDECIVPWLSINNSCPVCRSKLPLVVEERQRTRTRTRSRSRRTSTVVRFGSTIEEEEEEEENVVWGTTGVRRNRRSMSSPMLAVPELVPNDDPRFVEYAPRGVDFWLRAPAEIEFPPYPSENYFGLRVDGHTNVHHLDSEDVTDLMISQLQSSQTELN